MRRNWDALKDTPADAWIESRLGARVKNVLFERLAEMKFGVPLKELSAGWLGSRLREAAGTGENFAYPRSGIKTLIDRIAARFSEKGRLLLNTAAAEVSPGLVRAQDGREFPFDFLVSTVPPPTLLSIQKLSERLPGEIGSVKYIPMACALFGSKVCLSDCYWNVYMQPPLSFGGIFHHTVLSPGSGSDGEYIYYLFSYLNSESNPLWQKHEEELHDIHRDDIRRLTPAFKEEWWHEFKIRYAEPFFTRGYKSPPVRSQVVPNLYYAGVYRKFPQTRTMHTALGSGEETAGELLKSLS
jgi:protoporphyrinogen oxidase